MRIVEHLTLFSVCLTVSSAFLNEELTVSSGSPAAAAWKIPTSSNEVKAIRVNLNIKEKEMEVIQGHVKAIASINGAILSRSFYTFPGVSTMEEIMDELCFDKNSEEKTENELFMAFSTNIKSDLQIHITASFVNNC